MLEPRPVPGPLPGVPEPGVPEPGVPEPGAPDELVEFGVEVRSQWRLILGRFLRHRLALGSLFVLLSLVVVAFAGAHLSRHQYGVPGPDLSRPPSIHHWFGTNELGIDTFSQVQRGAQRSIEVAFLVAFLSTTFGSIVGALAGFYRGWIDTVLMRLTDLFLIIPTLAVLLVVAARYRTSRNSWLPIVIIIAAFTWMPLARLVRGVTLSLREREFVEAARAVGASDARIIFRHILPNSLGPIIVNATLVVAGAILVETALSFLGFGVQPPDVSLGLLISNGVSAASTRWWLFYPPGLFLLLFCLAINFVGDGLRDAFDPQQTRVRA